MKNLIIIIPALAVILSIASCSSGKGYGCSYSSADQEIKECRESNTNYIKKEITTIKCATS